MRSRCLVAVHHLLSGEGKVDEVFAGGAGQGALENGQEFFRLLLGHQPQGLVELGDDLPVLIHITART